MLLSQVRSLMEVPLLDPKKWGKIPELPADAFLVDLEDSAPLDQKGEAREKALKFIRDESGYFQGKPVVLRVNGLESEWGYDDLIAAAQSGCDVIGYPKVGSAGELELAQRILRRHGSQAALFALIESASGLTNLKDIAEFHGLAGLLVGPSDLALDMGWPLYEEETGLFSPMVKQAQTMIAVLGRHAKIPVFNTVFAKDFKNADAVRKSVSTSKSMGFTGVVTFYPPHLPIISEVYRPSEYEIEYAQRVVSLYEKAMHEGQTAVFLDGAVLIPQDYKLALGVLKAQGKEL